MKKKGEYSNRKNTSFKIVSNIHFVVNNILQQQHTKERERNVQVNFHDISLFFLYFVVQLT